MQVYKPKTLKLFPSQYITHFITPSKYKNNLLFIFLYLLSPFFLLCLLSIFMKSLCNEGDAKEVQVKIITFEEEMDYLQHT